MKFTFSFLALSTLLLVACSKKNDTTPKKSAPSVNIEGKDYSTVVIGTQTWTSVNYDGPGGLADSNLNEATFGKLYSLADAQNIVLPAGWRVPTENDFITLLKTQGTVNTQNSVYIYLNGSAAHLMSTSNWVYANNGDNQSGFNAEPAGIARSDNSFTYQYSATDFLSSTPDTSKTANINSYAILDIEWLMGSNAEGEADILHTTPYGLSLRFVKDN